MTLTSDVKQRKQRSQHNSPNPNNSYKTKKNFTGFYTEVNPILSKICGLQTSSTKRSKQDKIKLIIAHHEEGRGRPRHTSGESSSDDSCESTDSDYTDIHELHPQESSSCSSSDLE